MEVLGAQGVSFVNRSAVVPAVDRQGGSLTAVGVVIQMREGCLRCGAGMRCTESRFPYSTTELGAEGYGPRQEGSLIIWPGVE